jgi:hypothetical protein
VPVIDLTPASSLTATDERSRHFNIQERPHDTPHLVLVTLIAGISSILPFAIGTFHAMSVPAAQGFPVVAGTGPAGSTCTGLSREHCDAMSAVAPDRYGMGPSPLVGGPSGQARYDRILTALELADGAVTVNAVPASDGPGPWRRCAERGLCWLPCMPSRPCAGKAIGTCPGPHT